jgi:hypothetical protein
VLGGNWLSVSRRRVVRTFGAKARSASARTSLPFASRGRRPALAQRRTVLRDLPSSLASSACEILSCHKGNPQSKMDAAPKEGFNIQDRWISNPIVQKARTAQMSLSGALTLMDGK